MVMSCLPLAPNSANVVSDGVVDTDLALLVELHHGGGGDQVLGERGHVEDGVLGHGFARGLK